MSSAREARTDAEWRARVRGAVLRRAKASWAAATAQRDSVVAPISPSDPSLITAALEGLELGEDDLVVDLGCGDARWLVEAVARFGCRAYGCDIDEGMLERARSRVASELSEELRPRVELEARDFVASPPTARIADASVIVTYWFSEATTRLRPLLALHARPAALVLSVFFRFKGARVERTVHVGARRVLMYRTGDLSEAIAPGGAGPTEGAQPPRVADATSTAPLHHTCAATRACDEGAALDNCSSR